MIDIATEQLFTLSQLAKRLPERRRRRPVHPSTVHRWRFPGINGIRLECLKVGGAWHSSIQALQRFAEQLSQRDFLNKATSAGRAAERDPVNDARHQEQVEQELINRIGG